MNKVTQAAVLVVEDHQVSRELVVALLTTAGYTVLEAGCAGYLTKPLDTQILLKTVARILDR